MDTLIRSLSRDVAMTGDPILADKLAVAMVRAGRAPAFVDYITPPATRWGIWGGPVFGSAGAVRLSIQAGDGKYSEPRRNGLTAAEYSEWELAIVSKDGLLSILSDPFYATMPGREHWECERNVGPYVPVATVQAIFEWMILAHGAPRREQD